MKQMIFGLVIALLAVVFAIQNATTVQVNFLFWDKNISLALLLILVLGCGIAAGMLVLAPSVVRKNSIAKTLSKKISELEKTLSEHASPNRK